VRKIDAPLNPGSRTRCRLRAVAALVLSLLMSSCNTVEERLIEQGIGTELAADDIVESTRKLEEYLFYLCGQAGIASTSLVDGVPSQGACATNGNAGWTPIVKAGFNDIDRRCDSYLAWLNSRRRNETAILNQIHDTRTFTEALLFTAGVSAAPITIAGLAFGLASNSFTNYYSRLLLEVEKSTVEVVVRQKRLEYRANFNIVVTNQPDAVHLLREYLLICTPFYIEDTVNQRTRDSVAGNVPADTNDINQIRKSIVAGALLASIPPGGPGGALPGAGGNQKGAAAEARMSGGSTEVERNIAQSTGKVIQANLCVPVTGTFDTPTRDAIKEAKSGANQSTPGPTPFKNTQNEILSARETQIFFGAGPCSVDNTNTKRNYQTAFEKFALPQAASIISLQEQLAKCDPRLNNTSGIFDQPTRDAIKVAKGKAANSNFKVTNPQSDSLDSITYNSITRACH
jgi:hypothetical protein